MEKTTKAAIAVSEIDVSEIDDVVRRTARREINVQQAARKLVIILSRGDRLSATPQVISPARHQVRQRARRSRRTPPE
jgi:hypothetical protein